MPAAVPDANPPSPSASSHSKRSLGACAMAVPRWMPDRSAGFRGNHRGRRFIEAREETTLMKTLWLPVALAATFVCPRPGHAQTIDKPSLSLDGERKVIAAVKQDAARRGAPGAAIAVAADGGNLLAVERLAGTFAAGAHMSIGKARTAALFRRPTRVFEELINKGRTSMTALTDFTPLQGGVPILQ